MSSTISRFVRHKIEHSADGLPLETIWFATWEKSAKWDSLHANREELATRETPQDLAAIKRARQAFLAGDSVSAVEVWRRLAEQGSVWCMAELGHCYEYGVNDTIDLGEAERWYRLALAGGSLIAMLDLARLLAKRGNHKECLLVLQPGVQSNWAPALFWSAFYRYKQVDTSTTYRLILPMLREAADQGHPAAKAYLANFMVRGKFGLLLIPAGLLRVISLTIAARRCDKAPA